MEDQKKRFDLFSSSWRKYRDIQHFISEREKVLNYKSCPLHWFLMVHKLCIIHITRALNIVIMYIMSQWQHVCKEQVGVNVFMFIKRVSQALAGFGGL